MRAKKRSVKTVVRQGTFTQRVVNVWNSLPGKVVAAEKVEKFKLELDRYLELMEIEGDVGDVERNHANDDRYKHQIWHICSPGYSNQICLIGYLKIQILKKKKLSTSQYPSITITSRYLCNSNLNVSVSAATTFPGRPFHA